MRWTRYSDECLRLLEEKKEYPTDELLVYLTRVQLICNKGSSTTINDLFCDAEIGVPADFYVKTLKSQLDNVEQSIPPGLRSNGNTCSVFPSLQILMYSSYIETPHPQHNPHYPRAQFDLQPKDISLRSDRETAVHRKSLDLFHSGQILVQHIFLT